MRISTIEVTELFGIFNHRIEFDPAEHIKIVYGPNGIGKTVLLTMINGLFHGRYTSIRRLRFSKLFVSFFDGGSLTVTKVQSKTGEDSGRKRVVSELHFESSEKGDKPFVSKQQIDSTLGLEVPLSAIEHFVPELSRIGAETWRYGPTMERLTLREVMERWGELIPRRKPRGEEEPEWLKKIRTSIHVRFIDTLRLRTAKSPRDYEAAEPTTVPSVLAYSDELANAIQAKLAEYATLSQSLDRTFPKRLVTGAARAVPKVEQLTAELTALEERRSRLMSTGLLDREREIDFSEFGGIAEDNANVLSVYIEDAKQKLAVLDELTNRIDLLVNTVNSRFLHKEMTISKKEGFVFKSKDGTRVPAANLSSGEQHELVLFYELLFRVRPNSLVLIDEPELSLHVVWQQLFLKDLEEITRLIGFNVLIATHSPQIVHDRWDWTVELKGAAQ